MLLELCKSCPSKIVQCSEILSYSGGNNLAAPVQHRARGKDTMEAKQPQQESRKVKPTEVSEGKQSEAGTAPSAEPAIQVMEVLRNRAVPAWRKQAIQHG